MADLEVLRYIPRLKEEWDSFVESSKNATFLLKRDYMDYHSDRFHDCSLIFYRNGYIYALLPACIINGMLSSHGGLTYGGLVTGTSATTADILHVFGLLTDFISSEGLKGLTYKPIPHIYHTLPAEEDLYALFRKNAILKGRNVASVIDRDNRIKFRRIRESGVKKARQAGINVVESKDFKSFWAILDQNLYAKYGAHPVHSLDEITYLAERFPGNIKLFSAFFQDRMVGGIVIYLSGNVAHCQYISATPLGKEMGAIDAITDTILPLLLKQVRYFDFGTSNELGGKILNENLIYQKEGFGARAVCYDTYEILL